MKSFILFIALLSASAHARIFHSGGGMIGGGEVSFKSLVSCDLDVHFPTFSQEVALHVVYEVDYDGRRVPNADLIVITTDGADKFINAYPSNTREMLQSPDGSFGLTLEMKSYEYDRLTIVPLGTLKLDRHLMAGSLNLVVDYGQSGSLFNCHTF